MAISPFGRFVEHAQRAPHETAPLRWAVNDFALVWSRAAPAACYEVLERYA